MVEITAREIADKWGVSLRYVQSLCQKGRVRGAHRKGRDWIIPADAVRPVDGRSKAGKVAKEESAHFCPLVRKTPFLDMTDLYREPGTADQCIEALVYHSEAQALFAAEIAYSRGEIDKVYENAQYFLDHHTGLYATISGAMLLSLSAMWKGDVQLWFQAKKHLFEAPCKDALDRDIVALSMAAMDSAIRDTRDFPEWFVRGCFDNLHRDAHPAARVYYIKHLLIYAQELAMGHMELEGIKGIGLMRMLPFIMEPMISQMVADRIVMAEIYLRILCAIAYHQCGDDVRAANHLDRAIRLCLADGLYGPLVEHRNQLGLFLDDRLSMIDPEAVKIVKVLHKQLHVGWTKLHNTVLQRTVQVSLTNREREVARLAVFGLTDQQIAAQLYISESAVKSSLRNAKNKAGVFSRADLAAYI